MIFEWDDDKNESNFSKHGIWFEEAQTLWIEDFPEFFDPDHSDYEERFIKIGYSAKNRLILVIFCERLEGRVIRLISARKATKREVQEYEEGI